MPHFASLASHWWRPGALVIGTALGLTLAGAPPVVKSAQIEQQLALGGGEVINEVTINAVTQRTCAGSTCSCQGAQIATGGGARCADRDTLMSSYPLSPSTWFAFCQRLTEVRGVVPGPPPVLVVFDIIRVAETPASTYVVCSTP
jgi:hypothetical protein